MNLNDLYETRDPRDAYERDIANSTSGFGKDSQAYRADGGANDERHDLAQRSSTWYIRLNGKLIRDKSGNPYAFQDKAAANKAARTMQAKLFNKDKEFMLTTNPNDKPQGMAEGSQRVDSIVTDALKIMKGSGLNDAVQALKTVLGDREYNDRRGHYNFYVRQLMDMYGQQDMAEGHTEVKDKEGKVVSWKDDSEWRRAEKNKQGQPKDPRGVVTHLSDVARRKTADQQGMAEMWGNPYDDDKVDAINAANPPKISGTGTKPVVPAKNIAPAPRQANTLDHDAWDKFTRGVAEVQGQPLTVQQLATVSDAALDKAYGYGRSQPGNSFGWQANLKSAAFAKQMIDKGVTDIEAISDAIHKGWNTTAQAFVQNPEQFDDTAKLKAAGKLEAKLQQRAQLMKQNYGQLPEEEKEKDRVVARALLQALKGGQDVEEGYVPINKYNGPSSTSYITKPKSDGIGSRLLNKAKEKINTMKGLDPSGHKIQSYEWNSKDNTKNLPPEIYWQDQYVKVTNYDIPQAQNVSKNKVDTDYYVKHATKIKELLASHGIEVPDIEDRSAISNWEPIRLQQGVAEGDVDSDGYSMDHADSGEYDYEGDQARDQMNTIVRAARRLNGMLDDNENMPEWVQMKVTLAADYLDTAADYIESNQEPELAEDNHDDLYNHPDNPKNWGGDHNDQAMWDEKHGVAEGERGRGRPPSNTQDTTPVTPGRVEKTATGIRHHADASRYGGTEPDDDEDDYLMSKSHISRLGKMTEPDIDEGEKVGNMDADKFDAAMARLKQLAGAGPMKTVYDPTKRVYRNVPVAVQPKK